MFWQISLQQGLLKSYVEYFDWCDIKSLGNVTSRMPILLPDDNQYRTCVG
jgi:hypothetical protein